MRLAGSACTLLFAIVVCHTLQAQKNDGINPPHVLTCGRSAVVESEVVSQANSATLKPVWTWTPETSKGMPQELIKNFSTIDECKPASEGRELLVTSSHDGVALVSRSNGRTLFSANVKNAHSAVLLPDNLIAVASSDAADGTGDRVVFFDRRISNVRLAKLSLRAAHGLIWDEQRKVLWADGFNQMVCMKVSREQSGAVHVVPLKVFNLPESTGHDFHMSSDCSTLYVSTTHSTYEFPIALQTFRPFQPLADIVDVKSFSIDPSSGQVVYTVADKGGYWTSTLRFARTSNTAQLPTPIYKTRWVSDLSGTCNAQ